jgi:hypothetical protein
MMTLDFGEGPEDVLAPSGICVAERPPTPFGAVRLYCDESMPPTSGEEDEELNDVQVCAAMDALNAAASGARRLPDDWLSKEEGIMRRGGAKKAMKENGVSLCARRRGVKKFVKRLCS